MDLEILLALAVESSHHTSIIREEGQMQTLAILLPFSGLEI